MNIFLVGNGPTANISHMIDAADLVIRMNKVPTFGRTTGTKTDWLVLVNTGDHGVELITNIEQNPAYSFCSEIVFPLSEDLLIEERKRLPEFPGFNNSSGLVSTHKPVRTVEKSIVDSLDQKLRLTDQTYIMASTGMIMVEYLLSKFSHINICGFGHSGWSGHPWMAEQKLINTYIRSKRITRI